jgi:hypothetical protein
MTDFVDSLLADAERPLTNAQALSNLAGLLARSGIDLASIGRVDKVGLYQGFYKDNDGVAHVVDMSRVLLSPTWADGPQWPVVQPARPVTAKPRPVKATKRTNGVQRIFVAPDPQIGCRRYEDGTLDWFQDDRAIACSLALIRASEPTRILNLGDTCDFPEWSAKFLISPEYVMTTQPTLDRTHRYLSEQLTEAPEGCEMDMMEGNHDARLGYAITRNAMAALRLRRANVPESWPVLSLQSLLRLDDIAKDTGSPVRYHDGYPAGRLKLAEGDGYLTPLYAIHGERLTVSAVAKSERQSFVQGHIHRIQDHYETYEVNGDPQVVNAWSPGCLSKIDGTIPSVKGGANAKGRPIRRMENWTQGVGLVTVMPDGSWEKEIIPIRNGVAIWRGERFEAA